MFAVDEARLITGEPFDVEVGITLYQPTVREVLCSEDEYLRVVTAVTSEPFDMPYYLNEIGRDFEKTSSIELFYLMTSDIPQASSRLLFGDLDFTKFRLVQKDGEMILINPDGVIIDSITRERIADNVRRMHCLPKNILKSCENKTTHDLMIYQQKRQIERTKRKRELFGESSTYAAYVSSLSCEWHSYDKVLGLKIGQFFDALTRLGYRINADNLYKGLYAGTVSYKNINKKELDWMRPIKIKIL